MSTRIYTGYRFDEGTEVFSVVEQLCVRGRERLAEVVERVCVVEVVRALDVAWYLHEPSGENLWFGAWRALDERVGGGELELRVEFYRAQGRVQACVFDRSRCYGDAWESLGAKEWAYWDNTDRPEEVEDREWRERKQSWDEALTRSAPLVFELLGTPAWVPLPVLSKELWERHQPDRALRAVLAAKELARAQGAKELLTGSALRGYLRREVARLAFELEAALPQWSFEQVQSQS